MPKGSRGGRRTQTITTSGTGSGGPIVFGAFSDTDASQLRDEVDDLYTASVLDAIKQYISKATDAAGYSKSQNLNHKLNNDLNLNVNEKFMDKYLTEGMHDIGKDVVLYRGAHEDLLQSLGIRNYQNMSESQLKQALVGAEYISKSYTSASYDKNKNPFYIGPNSGGREIEMVIKAPSNTKIVFGAKSQAEMVVNKGTKYRITGVHYTGRTATPRNSGAKPVLQLDLEIVG